MTLGEQIKQKRKAQGMTQEILAQKAGIKRQHLTRLENNITQNPSFETLKNIAQALKIEVYELMDESVDKRPTEEILDDIQTTHLISNFNKLNFKGKDKAIEQVKMLTKISEYQKENE